MHIITTGLLINILKTKLDTATLTAPYRNRQELAGPCHTAVHSIPWRRRSRRAADEAPRRQRRPRQMTQPYR